MLLLAAVAVVVPAALLSAVPPMVVKLQLASLTETGSVVGRLSGIGTLGAIAATFATGFLLVAVLPSSVILVGTGVGHRGWPASRSASCCGGGRRSAPAACRRPCWSSPSPARGSRPWRPRRARRRRPTTAPAWSPTPSGTTGRVLLLDTLRHSYVDLADPTHLEFEYVRAIAAVTDVVAPPGRAAVGAAHRRRRAHAAALPRRGPARAPRAW